MGRQHRQVRDLGVDRNPLAVNPDEPFPGQDGRPAGARHLIAGDHDGVARIRGKCLEVMQNPAAGGHSAGGQHDLGVVARRDPHGLLGVAGIGGHRAHTLVDLWRQPVIVPVAAQQITGVDGHRTVQVDRHIRQRAGGPKLPQVVQQGLGTADREGRDHDGAAALHRRVDDLGQGLHRVGALMQPVAVGGLHHQVVRGRHRLGVEHHRIVVAAQITGEDDAAALPLHIDGGGPQDVTGAAELHHRRPVLWCGRVPQAELLSERVGPEQLHGPLGVVAVVERQRGVVLAGPVLVEECRVTLLQVGAVPQDDLGDGLGRLRRHDRSGESVAHQPRQVAGVVEVSMGHHHGVDAGRLDGQGLPIELAKVLHTLEQPAIDQDSTAVALQQMLGAGHGARSAQAGQRQFPRIPHSRQCSRPARPDH